jgi:hypothetical protein
MPLGSSNFSDYEVQNYLLPCSSLHSVSAQQMLMINCYVPHPVLSSGVTLLGVGSRERERERERERGSVCLCSNGASNTMKDLDISYTSECRLQKEISKEKWEQ